MILSFCHLILLLLLHFCIWKIYLLSCVHFCSFHAVTLLGQGLSVTKAAEVAMAPVTKAFPIFSGALIAADALGNFGEFSVLTYFFHFGISQSFDGRSWTGRFSFKPVGGSGGEEINTIKQSSVNTIKQSSISQYNFNVHICTENE